MESSYTDSDIVSLSSHGSITPARQEPATAAPTLPLSLDDCFLQLSAAFARARLETPQDKEVKRKYRAFTAFEETFMEQEGEEEVAVAVGDKELEVARSEVQEVVDHPGETETAAEATQKRLDDFWQQALRDKDDLIQVMSHDHEETIRRLMQSHEETVRKMVHEREETNQRIVADIATLVHRNDSRPLYT